MHCRNFVQAHDRGPAAGSGYYSTDAGPLRFLAGNGKQRSQPAFGNEMMPQETSGR